MVFCRTNVDCDNLEAYLRSLGGGRGFAGKVWRAPPPPNMCPPNRRRRARACV